MGIEFLESLAPISQGDVTSLSPPVDRIMPNEGAVIMSPSVSLIFRPEPMLYSTLAFRPVISKRPSLNEAHAAAGGHATSCVGVRSARGVPRCKAAARGLASWAD